MLISREAAWLSDSIPGDTWIDGYPNGTMGLAYWGFIGDWSDVFNVFETTAIGVYIIGAFLLLAQLLLGNLLIAIMNDTYTLIRDNADMEWKYAKYDIYLEYRDDFVLPVPFKIFEQVYRWMKRGPVIERRETRAKQFRDSTGMSEEEIRKQLQLCREEIYEKKLSEKKQNKPLRPEKLFRMIKQLQRNVDEIQKKVSLNENGPGMMTHTTTTTKTTAPTTSGTFSSSSRFGSVMYDSDDAFGSFA
eukprot:TRINITY_DN2700_c0_g1_i4.p1 TRINITY_DN2700_c0_g1~~TRINITY_DN2700_c0_g1_i4.p1  ORF type:complete len:246 (-),score=73.32 TRINITY_DN2700_c0_g1_i4:73-810(-)